jgi:pimeloyl-ACP methyl ester carboxylesterase
MSISALPSPDLAEERGHHQLAASLAGLEIDEFVSPSHHDVVLGGMRFHYLDWGRRGKPVVLLLHGGGQTARTWDLPCLMLRRDFHCIALDQRGHGDSEWSYAHEYGADDHAKDVEGLLDHLGVETAVVVGMSMGCVNGLHFVARRPDRVRAFVAVDAGPWIRFEGGRRISNFMAAAPPEGSLRDWIDHALRFNPRRDRRLLRRSLLYNMRQLPDGSLTWKSDRRRTLDIDTMSERLEQLRERVLPEVLCPTLIVRGGESDVFFDEDAERFANALPNARWVRVEGAGHSVQGDRPGALVEEIRKFLALLD